MSSRLLARILLSTALISVPVELAAQETDEDRSVVNFAYAVFFGTGVYEVDDQTAFVVRAPLSHELREPSPERAGVRLLLPVLVGFYDYDQDSVLEADVPGDAATLSFVPGLAFEHVMNERWRLKPFGQIGFGRDLENDENALIYLVGTNSHYRLPAAGEWQFALGNTLTWAGFDPDDGGSESLGILGAGVDAISPWAFEMFGARMRLAGSLIYYYYMDSPGFEQGENRSEDVRDEFEVSAALDFGAPRKFMGIAFDRIGLGFRHGDNLRGLRLVTNFPF